MAAYFFLGKPSFTSNTVPSDRLVTTSNGVKFSHPETFSGNIRRAMERSPKVTKVTKDQDAQAIACPQIDENQITQSGMWASDGLHYVFTISEDLWAGQRYTSFCYIFSGEQANYVLNFEIHSPIGCGSGACGPYCDTEFEQECKDFDMIKDIEEPIDRILSTVNLIE